MLYYGMFDVISISMISGGDHVVLTIFVWILPLCATFMFHDALLHHNGS